MPSIATASPSNELDGDAHRLRRPFAARRAPADRALARLLPAIDLAAGDGHAEHVLVDRVVLRLRAHAKAALLEIFLLVGADFGVLLLDLADRRDDLVVAERLDREIEAHLIVAHAGAAVREDFGAELVAAFQRFLDDDVAIRDEQRILALVELAGLDQRLHEAVPDRLRSVDRAMRGDAELLRALLDVIALLGRNAAGVGEHRVHRIAAFLEVRHAEARVEAAREREHDVPGSSSMSFLARRARP